MDSDRLPGDKVAVVTGASLPFARDVASRLAADGARVVVSDTDAGRAKLLAATLGATGARAVPVVADTSDAAAVANMFDEAACAFGRVDVLVQILPPVRSSVHFLKMDESYWDEVLRTRLTSVYVCSRRAALLMVQQGAGGCIVTISPFAGIGPAGSLAAAGASHGAVEAFTRSIARDLVPFHVRANVVIPVPGQAPPIGGYNVRAAPPDAVDPAANDLAALDTASAVAFLCSERAADVTGQSIHVRGTAHF